jgi:hypothetical protein
VVVPEWWPLLYRYSAPPQLVGGAPLLFASTQVHQQEARPGNKSNGPPKTFPREKSTQDTLRKPVAAVAKRGRGSAGRAPLPLRHRCDGRARCGADEFYAVLIIAGGGGTTGAEFIKRDQIAAA